MIFIKILLIFYSIY